MRKHASEPLHIEPLYQPALRAAGLYWRRHDTVDGQRIDHGDGRPFSTDFTFSRFLVPALCQWRGWALFCDSDFLWRRDVAELFEARSYADAVMVVQHQFEPEPGDKMRGQRQEPYSRKAWSSLMLLNCEHPDNAMLTPDVVNMRQGRWLHGLRWVADEHIGEINARWNWLEGYEAMPDPWAVHYTRGTPDMPGHEGSAYADEWREYA